MPIVDDNNFSKDSYSTRAERLIAIQSNFDTVQPDLQAPAHILAWAEDCYDVFCYRIVVKKHEYIKY